MPAIRPAGTKNWGNTMVVFVPTLTSLTSPSVAEATAVSALDVTKMFYQSSPMPDASTDMVEAPMRIGDVESYEFTGQTKWTLGEVRYSFNPQAAAASDGKKAFEKFPQGTTGYLIVRRGMNRDTALAVGQFVSIYPVEFGVQVESTEGDGAGSEVAIKQGVAVTSTPSINKALAA